MRRWLSLTLLSTALAACASPEPGDNTDSEGAPLTLALDTNQLYTLASLNSNLLLDVAGVSKSDGATVWQWAPTGATNQQWRFVPVAGAYQVVSVNSGKCLEIANGSTQAGAYAQQWACVGTNGQANQLWKLQQQSNGTYELTNVGSGMVLDIAGMSLDNGGRALQWPTWHGKNEQWVLTPVAAPTPPAGTCDAGTTQTAWANQCPSGNTYGCTAGTWVAHDPTSPTMPAVRYETPHFALRWNGDVVTSDQAAQAAQVLEMIWNNHVNVVGFIEPFCKQTTKWKVNIHLDPSFGLTGGGTGSGDLAMWIPPGTLTDHWGLAHEFAHSLQAGSRNMTNTPYGGWFWESHANFMAHTLPEYHSSNVHCSELLVNFPHLYFGSTRDRYCNWQLWEYYKDRFCMQAVDNIWSNATGNNQDPLSVIKANQQWSMSQMNDFLGEWAMHNITWDYRDPDGTAQGPQFRQGYGPITDRAGGAVPGWRRLRTTQLDTMDAGQRRFAVPSDWAPQRMGYNVVRLFPDAGATSVGVTFRGVLQSAAANTQFGNYSNQPASISPPNADWRWGLVAVDSTGTKARYSALQRGSDGALTFCIGAADAQLFLVVMGTPTAMQQVLWDQMYYTLYRYPWMVQLTNALPDGAQANAPTPSANGKRWPNGGGWVDNSARVDASAYVGPQAAVLGGSVLGNARIDGHAVVLNATVRDSASVGALSVLAGGIVVGGNASVKTVFQAPGTYEPQQSVVGTAQLWGDVELRGQGTALSAGSYYGIVDGNSAKDPLQGASRTGPVQEVTAPPPYVWR